jgi:hypothetical protein
VYMDGTVGGANFVIIRLKQLVYLGTLQSSRCRG